MALILQDETGYNPTKQTFEVSYHMKPPVTRALHLGRQRVFKLCKGFVSKFSSSESFPVLGTKLQEDF